jgi:hypothetical protein
MWRQGQATIDKALGEKVQDRLMDGWPEAGQLNGSKKRT